MEFVQGTSFHTELGIEKRIADDHGIETLLFIFLRRLLTIVFETIGYRIKTRIARSKRCNKATSFHAPNLPANSFGSGCDFCLDTEREEEESHLRLPASDRYWF